MIRAAENRDLCPIIALHNQYLGEYYLARLGDSFLLPYYTGILQAHSCQIFVYEHEREVMGYLVATIDSRKLLSELLNKQGLKILTAIGKFVIGKPANFFQLLEIAAYPINAPAPKVQAELLYIALDNSQRKSGASELLVLKALAWLKDRGIKQVKVSTSADNQGANQLLQGMGFSLEGSFSLLKKNQHLYLASIDKILTDS